MAKRVPPNAPTLDPTGFVTRTEFLEAHAGLNSEIGDIKADIGGIKTEIGDIKADIGGMKTEMRAMVVTLERVDSNIRGLTETVVSMGQTIRTQMTDLELRLSNRIEVLESVVRENSVAIQKNSADIRELRLEVRGLRHDFDHRAEAPDLERLDARVTALEARARLRPK